jgi:hypothetical protein
MLKVLLVIVVVAVTIYVILRLIERGGLSRAEGRKPRTVAPDDDADFLRDIDRQRRRRTDEDTG